MANKYIDHLTLEEYKDIINLLTDKLEQLTITVNEKTQSNKDYVKFRFMKMKIQSIIKKYEKV